MKSLKSTKITHIMVRSCYVLLGAVAIFMPIVLENGLYEFEILSQIRNYIYIPFYLVVPAGYIALVCLDKLLVNVKKDYIFESENVSLIRIISYACFYAGFVGLISFIVIMSFDFMFETLIVLAAGEMFMGLVVRVVKNIFERAIAIKEENDLTV